MQWNATGETVAGTGFAGNASNELDEPWNLFVDSNYNLYIADSANHRIQFWSAGASSGTTIAGVNATPGSGPTELDTPSDVFVEANGDFYVADRNNSRIQFFPNGSTTGITVSSGWGGTGGFRGVQVTSTGIIYGSDTTNNELWGNGSVVLGFGGAGNASDQLNGNQGIAVDMNVNVGYVYIANANQHTIVEWVPGSSNGTVVAGTNGVQGNTTTTMAYPVAVRIDQYGNLFIVDNNNHRIQVYCRYPTVSTTARTVAGITGTPGNSSTTLYFPTGIALDKDLNIYVADTSNHRIQKFVRTI